jgi:hypothetical protein
LGRGGKERRKATKKIEERALNPSMRQSLSHSVNCSLSELIDSLDDPNHRLINHPTRRKRARTRSTGQEQNEAGAAAAEEKQPQKSIDPISANPRAASIARWIEPLCSPDMNDLVLMDLSQ